VNEAVSMDTIGPTLGWLGAQLDPLGRLLLAALLGAVLGAEREYRQRSAGLRTNTLIALGSALFTLVSIQLQPGDATRIPSQVVTGIGFLGGGAILRGQGDVRGLTTAATIWVNAAVGMAAGAGFYSLAIVSTVATLLVLTVFLKVEERLGWRPPDQEERKSPIVRGDDGSI
jgi:putative Mg2+ transporter-C (MgtC) family protein